VRHRWRNGKPVETTVQDPRALRESVIHRWCRCTGEGVFLACAPVGLLAGLGQARNGLEPPFSLQMASVSG